MAGKTKICMMLAVVIGIAGCSIDPRKHETPPVEVASSKGIVTCQLYTRDTIVWDRAIDIPRDMTIAEGDRICRQEGQRLINAGA